MKMHRKVWFLAIFFCGCINAVTDTLYVWSNDGTIRKFDASGVPLPFTTTNLPGDYGPVGLALDNAGNLYAADGAIDIFRFKADGSGSFVGSADLGSGLAFDHNGFLYATSPGWLTLSKLDYVSNSTVNPSGFWQQAGQQPGGPPPTNNTQVNLSYPVTLAFDRSENIYVSNPTSLFGTFLPYSNTIQTFSADLSFLETFATNLNGPWGLAFDSADNLYVANSGTNGNLSNTILKFTSDGLSSIFASSTNGLSAPKGLAFDSAGNLYVANSGNGTIQKFTVDGTGSVFASGLDSPTSIAIFPGLNVWSATPIKLHPMVRTNGAFGLVFTSTPGLSFTVVSTTNLSLANWVAAGVATETYPFGTYEFSDPQAKNTPQIYYRVVAQ